MQKFNFNLEEQEEQKSNSKPLDHKDSTMS